MNDAKIIAITPEEFHKRMEELNTRINRWEMMDGYDGPNNLIKKLEYATGDHVDLYWGEVMELLHESLKELREYEKLKSKTLDD